MDAGWKSAVTAAPCMSCEDAKEKAIDPAASSACHLILLCCAEGSFLSQMSILLDEWFGLDTLAVERWDSGKFRKERLPRGNAAKDAIREISWGRREGQDKRENQRVSGKIQHPSCALLVQ